MVGGTVADLEESVMTLNEFLLFVLLVAAATWYGGSIAGAVIGAQVARGGDEPALGRLAAAYSQVAAALFGGSGFLALAAGVWLVAISDELAFSDAWVVIALVGWFVSIVFAATAVGLSWTRLAIALGHGPHEDGDKAKARAEAGPAAGTAALVARALRLSWVDIALRTVVVLLVVWQPA